MTSSQRRFPFQRREMARGTREVAKFPARVRQFEAINETLGKVIRLLHALNEQVPDVDPPARGRVQYPIRQTERAYATRIDHTDRARIQTLIASG